MEEHAEEALFKGVADRAFGFVFEHWKQIAALAALPLLAQLAIWLLLSGESALLLVNVILGVAVYAVYAIAIHRLVLLNEFSILPPRDDRLVAFAIMVIAESMIIGLAAFAVVFPTVALAAAALGSGIRVLALVGGILSAVAVLAISLGVSARLIALFPHIAVTPPPRRRLRAAFELTKGHVVAIALRLFGVGIVASVPYIALIFVPGVRGIENAETMAERSALLPASILQSGVDLLVLAVFVVFASLTYQRLTDNLAAPDREG